MAVIQELIILLFFLLTIALLSFKKYYFKRFYIELIIFFLIIIGSIESSFLNGTHVLKMYKQHSDEYIKEVNIKYPISASNQVPPQYNSISNIIEKLSFLKPTDNNNASILQNGNNIYNTLFAEMNNAKSHIHIEDFIIRNDETGKKFKDILMKKSSQGVKVRLIVDAFGSKLNSSTITKLKKSGIEVVTNGPILKSLFQGNFNNRDHRKIYIIDGKIAFTGGINIGNEYLGYNPKIGYWRDTDIMLTGDSVKQLQSVFLSDWYAHTGQKIFDSLYFPKLNTDTNATIQIATGYPAGENPIEYTYLALVNSAQKSIFIETPYLTLDDPIFKALSSAALRGISIIIIIPSKPDEKIAYSSTLQNADKLSDFGIKIYKYPTFIHSKLVIIDGNVASIGTVNFNNRSMHLDLEDSAIIYGGTILDSLNKMFQEDFTKSNPFIPGESKPKGILNLFYSNLSKIIFNTI